MAVKWCVFPSQLEELVRGIFTPEEGEGVRGRGLHSALCHTCSVLVHVRLERFNRRVGEVSVCGQMDGRAEGKIAPSRMGGAVRRAGLVVLKEGEKVVVAVGGEIGGVQVRQ